MKGMVSNSTDFSSFFGAKDFERVKELFVLLDKPLFARKDTGITHRNLNWYIKEGAISDEVNYGAKYTFVQFIWIKIVEQLRIIGVSVPLIKQYRERLCSPLNPGMFAENYEAAKKFVSYLKIPNAQKETILISMRDKAMNEDKHYPFSLLHIAIVDTFVMRKPFSFAFFPDGDYFPVWFDKERIFELMGFNVEKLMFGSCALISLSGIMKDFLKTEISSFVMPQLNLFDEPTNKLIELIHSGKYDSITVNFKNKKIKSLELKKGHDVKEKIADILSKNDFQDIVIKKHKGVITKIENKVKLLFDE